MIGFWIAFLVSALSIKPIMALLRRLNSRQTVSQHAPEGHQAKQGTPTMGGLIILVGAFAGIGLGNPVAEKLFPNVYGDAGMGLASLSQVWFLLLIASFALIGFVDDFVVPRYVSGKRGLGWKQKIAMQVLGGILAIPALRLSWSPVNVGLTLFIVLACSNAYNFLDGLDALAGSVGAVLFLTLGLFFAGDASQVLPFAGGLLAFLFVNAPPARVFMGDVGSLPIGATIGCLYCRLLVVPRMDGHTSWQSDPTMWFVLSALSSVLIAELLPVPLQIFWVKVFKRKLFSFTPIHHAFEKAGWKESRVVWSFLATQGLAAMLALTILVLSDRINPFTGTTVRTDSLSSGGNDGR